jgi:hypothetical protein
MATDVGSLCQKAGTLIECENRREKIRIVRNSMAYQQQGVSINVATETSHWDVVIQFYDIIATVQVRKHRYKRVLLLKPSV